VIKNALRLVTKNGTSGISPPTPVEVRANANGAPPDLGFDCPGELARECLAVFEAMLPRSQVKLFVPDLDKEGRSIPVREIAAQLRRDIVQITGGQTTYTGTGDYVDSAEVSREEHTAVIETFLPRTITDSMRWDLIGLFVAFGRCTRQEIVLVAVETRGYRIPTEHLK
jgi:hypothetical protein